MNPASSVSVSWQKRIEQALVSHEFSVGSLYTLVFRLFKQVANMSNSPEQSPSTSASTGPTYRPDWEPKIPPPERYGGQIGECRPFLTQCELVFELQPSAFPTERAKVAYVLSLLTGRARRWGTAEWARRADCCGSFREFGLELTRIFDPANPAVEASHSLLSLTQGSRSAIDYIIDFQTAAADSGWNEAALMDAFYRGLSDRIKDALTTHDPSTDLQSLMDLVTRLDGRFRERQLERNRSSRPSRPTITPSHPSSWRTPEPKLSPSPSREEPEPMQLGRSRLTPEERERRFRGNLCLYCGASGHKALSCPLKGRAQHDSGGRC